MFDALTITYTPAPLTDREPIALTPLGYAGQTVIRLRRQLEGLEPAERAIVLADLSDAIRPLIADLAAGL